MAALRLGSNETVMLDPDRRSQLYAEMLAPQGTQ